ncbi:heptaprenylglyceryl phosphate synthase [Calditerricola yamamurae]
MMDVGAWRHVFKLDPNKPLSDDALEAVCESGTDAIVIGGTDGVTFDNTVELLARVRRYAVPCVQEISSLDAVVPGFDGYLVPLVLNAGDPDWLLRPHMEAIRRLGRLIRWDELVVEGYIVLNPEAKVARLTRSDASLDVETAAAYAVLAERLLSLPVVYIEYSGTRGDVNLVREVRRVLTRARLFYGGGVDGPEVARAMARVADTVVVGNAVYAKLEGALATVAAVKETPVNTVDV